MRTGTVFLYTSRRAPVAALFTPASRPPKLDAGAAVCNGVDTHHQPQVLTAEAPAVDLNEGENTARCRTLTAEATPGFTRAPDPSALYVPVHVPQHKSPTNIRAAHNSEWEKQVACSGNTRVQPHTRTRCHAFTLLHLPHGWRLHHAWIVLLRAAHDHHVQTRGCHPDACSKRTAMHNVQRWPALLQSARNWETVHWPLWMPLDGPRWKVPCTLAPAHTRWAQWA